MSSSFLNLFIVRPLIIIHIFAAASLGASIAQAEAAPDLPDTNRILQSADRATGDGFEGLTWKIDVVSTSTSGKTSEQTLQLKATEEKWVAETLRPRRSRGQKLLKVGNNMWFTKEGLRKPVPISMRQRLSGGASNGDVASTRYAKDYDAQILPEEVVDGVDCYVFNLIARHKGVTYDRLKYWVGKESGLGIKAEFYSKTGKLLKTARFEHDNQVQGLEQSLPFISRMTIKDELTKDVSEFVYYDVVVTDIPAADFRLQ